AAFSGLDVMRRAYAHAIVAGYRFYSYGDACLLFPSRRDAVQPSPLVGRVVRPGLIRGGPGEGTLQRS
ncbi:MAG TPA: S-adenosylmethionine:tRNA ribosyltransferase-isomerase, partial [Rhodoplanes sp.]|nr:S-adenosylmethionine:tRNA ribosyltransferase-isomerase [Rhodoplanes sp.]